MADSDFLPTRGGGEREHLGFVRAAVRADRLAAVVVPTDPETFDYSAYAAEVGDVPVVPIARRRSPVWLLHPRYPFVVASRPYRPAVGERLAALRPTATGVLTFSYKSRLIGAGLSRRLRLPMVVRQHNREGDYHRSLAAGSSGARRWVMTWEAWRIGRDERRFDRSPQVTAVADISAEDATARRAAGARRVVHVPPFAADIDPSDHTRALRTATGGRRVVFLGALDVVTNQAALDWFTTEVWPVVLRAHPEAELEVVGSRPPNGLLTRLSAVDRCTVHADVPDVAPFLAQADVAVNPAISGSGVNIKLVEYLRAGVPVVSTTLATRGLPLRAGVDLEVADEPGAFATAVQALLADPARADRMAVTGRDHLIEMLDGTRNLDRLADLFPPAPTVLGDTG